MIHSITKNVERGTVEEMEEHSKTARASWSRCWWRRRYDEIEKETISLMFSVNRKLNYWEKPKSSAWKGSSQQYRRHSAKREAWLNITADWLNCVVHAWYVLCNWKSPRHSLNTSFWKSLDFSMCVRYHIESKLNFNCNSPYNM